MLFWIVATALIAMIALLFGLALLRRPLASGQSTAAQDMQVYRDQLAEVDKDRQRGVISAEESGRARIEISRRMLEADRQMQAGTGIGARAGTAPRGLSVAAFVAVLAVLAAAMAAYMRLGAAGYPDQPLVARLAQAEELYAARPDQDRAEAEAAKNRPAAPAPDPAFAQLMERLRQAVAERPNDPRGLALLARNEMALGNFRAGWEAQRRLVALKGAEAEAADFAQLGEDMTVAAGGLVTKEAENAFASALQRDPQDGQSLYYIGLMMAQNGRGDRAFQIWDRLLRTSPADAPWQQPIRQNIRMLAWIAGEADYSLPADAASDGLPGPSQEEMAAARDMSPEDRAQMIRGMVERLNSRLAQEGGTAEEWARLVSALRMLGEVERARAIGSEAQAKFAADPGALQRIRDALAAPAGAALPPESPADPAKGAPAGAPPLRAPEAAASSEAASEAGPETASEAKP